jgi:hypothetical protein
MFFRLMLEKQSAHYPWKKPKVFAATLAGKMQIWHSFSGRFRLKYLRLADIEKGKIKRLMLGSS